MSIKIKVQATCDICPKRSTRSGDTIGEAEGKLEDAGWSIFNKKVLCPKCHKARQMGLMKWASEPAPLLIPGKMYKFP